MNFEAALINHLSNTDKATDTPEFAAFRKEVNRVVNSPHPPLKKKALMLMEHRALRAIVQPADSQIDWSTADWITITIDLLKWQPMILAIIGL